MGLTEYLILAIAALIFVVLFQVAKASESVGVLKGEEKTRAQSNKVNSWMLLGFMVVGLIAVWYCNHILYPKTLFPQGSASVQGEDIDRMMWITIAATGLVFFLTQILLFWFSFKYREKPGKSAFYFPHSTKLELIWTTIPAIVLLVLIVFGLKYWIEMTGEAPKDAVVVEVTGHQFGWDYRYGGKDGKLGNKNFRLYNNPNGNTLGVDFKDPYSLDDIRTTEMHIPVGKPVKLVIHSQDVIHDVGLPHFRMKMDAVPGIPTTLWFTPKYTTAEMKQRTKNPDFVYEISCDQMCGKGHFSMRGVIVVETPEEYNKWLQSQKSEYLTLFPEKAPKTDTITVAATTPVADTTKN